VAGDAYRSRLLVRGGGGGWWVTRTLRVCLREVVAVGGMQPGDVALSRGCRFLLLAFPSVRRGGRVTWPSRGAASSVRAFRVWVLRPHRHHLRLAFVRGRWWGAMIRVCAMEEEVVVVTLPPPLRLALARRWQ
jgi:hypothetical protein